MHVQVYTLIKHVKLKRKHEKLSSKAFGLLFYLQKLYKSKLYSFWKYHYLLCKSDKEVTVQIRVNES